ncbi:MAG: hypothetical protein FIB00_10625 [Chloroflexi bacterium]|nr:hypothetical protein [Chloroflexota bacterium]PWB45749.1 MAG: hypothetical protein C3F10_05495 [Dehalococcoidia bacterium]
MSEIDPVRVLVVEDRNDVIDDLESGLGAGPLPVQLHVARSRDSARVQLAGEGFDFMVCDLKIPTTDGALDEAEEHGLFIQQTAKTEFPGMPCFFLTAYGTVQNMSSPLAMGGTDDLYGDGFKLSLVEYFGKENLSTFLQRVHWHMEQLKGLLSISIETPESLKLDRWDLRAVRIFARRSGGTKVMITLQGGGLSSARTLSLQVLDDEARIVARAFAKIDHWREIKEERDRYERFVPRLLPVGSCPPIAGTVDAVIGSKAALFYTLASDHLQDFFSIAATDAVRASDVVVRVREVLKPWNDLAETKTLNVRELRRSRVRDELLVQHTDLLDIPVLDDLESRSKVMRLHRQHGDFHGRNVLVSDDGHPLLIDIRDAGTYPAGWDPIILEMSMLFLRDSPFAGCGWPTVAGARNWALLDAYGADCPFAELVRVVRGWALDEVLSPADAYVLAYVDALRQLKYPDTDKELAATIAMAAARAALAEWTAAPG